MIYTTNDRIYGKKYGSGKCYLCTKCGAYVGTHVPCPKEALGLLANAPMREWKVECHKLFDPMWRNKPRAQKKRSDLYRWLAKQMGVKAKECHFGYFNLEQLKFAYSILVAVHDCELEYDNNGELHLKRRTRQDE